MWARPPRIDGFDAWGFSRFVRIVAAPPSQTTACICGSLVVGAFTPLWSAAGGLLGPAFMPGFPTRPHAQSGRVPHATISAASCRARNSTASRAEENLE